MNINLSNLLNKNNRYLKKIQETGGSANDLVSDKGASVNKDKLFSDFADIRFSANQIKSRVLSNNIRLSMYEEKSNLAQFMRQQFEALSEAYQNGNLEKAESIINHGSFKGIHVLKGYFDNNQSIEESLGLLKDSIEEKEAMLNHEFKQLEIASQNIMSLSGMLKEPESPKVLLKQESLEKAYRLDQKNILELIS